MPTILLALVLASTIESIYSDIVYSRQTTTVENHVSLAQHDSVPVEDVDMETLWEQVFVLHEWDGKESISELMLARTVDFVLRKVPVDKKDGNTHALIMETAMVESHMGKFNVKNRCVGGLGIFQIHETSAKYILKKTSSDLHTAVMSFYDSKRSLKDNLENNVKFSVAMCALYYHEHGLSTRKLDTVKQRGTFWKEKYNTHKGAGTVVGYLKRNGYNAS